MKKNIYMSLAVALVSVFTLCFTACGGDDEEKDMSKPVISDKGITANPIDCQTYHRGDVIAFNYVFEDDTELGSFNIEIHNNFEHHTHSTSTTECEDEDEHEHHQPVKPWVFNQDYQIPAGQKSYTARFDIQIPADIDEGDYHFMVRLTDRAGWQELKGIAIKIEE